MATQSVVSIGGSGSNTGVVFSEWFVAKITSVSSTQSGTGSCIGYPHAWIEQKVCANGINYENAPAESAEVGTTTNNVAYPINSVNAQVNDLVLMRIRGIDQVGKTIFEFIPKSGIGGTGFVTSVQCTGGLLVVTY